MQDPFDRVKSQIAPCGIVCYSCNLGNGNVAETAQNLLTFLEFYQVHEWSPQIPGGSEVDFDKLSTALKWIVNNVTCPGCERGGGPPDCPIKNCANERGYELCSECPDLDACEKFDWLGDQAEELKARLRRSGGKNKPDLIDETLDRMGI